MFLARKCLIDYYFEWDPRKARNNLAKHGVSFEQATGVFQDPMALTIPDGEHSETEQRWITMGNSNGNLLIVVHIFVEESPQTAKIRVISTRKATRRERRQYEEVGL